MVLAEEGPEPYLIACNCPTADCTFSVTVPDDLLGRNYTCPSCRSIFTLRSHQTITDSLKQEELIASGNFNLKRLPFAILLDNIRSLWNVGSIFRSADCFGCSTLLLSGITGRPDVSGKQGKVISNTALGAERILPWSYYPTSVEALDRAVEQGFVPVAVELTPDAAPLHEFQWPSKPLLVLGNEVSGVGREVLSKCDHKIYLPMIGMKKSLNVACCCSVVLSQCCNSLITSIYGDLNKGLEDFDHVNC
ncbi:hypothetical protein P9112_007709 [Eukaryota sp. TZLM1-RC]